MGGRRPPSFTVIDGNTGQNLAGGPIAFSLIVYERKKLDVPVNEIVVKVTATQSFNVEEDFRNG